MKPFLHLFTAATLLVCSPAFAQTSAGDVADTATQYLNAWAYKDYATMYRLSSAETRKAMTEQAYYAAASALPVPAAAPKIANRLNSGTGQTLYVEFATAGSEAPARTSLQIDADGIKHPELLSRAAPAAQTSPAAGTGSGATGIGVLPMSNTTDTTPDRAIDGETAETVLAKMQKATEAAETLRSDLAMRGSIMGESINETAKLVYRAPDHIRMDSTKFILNGDGKKTILYLPQVSSYIDVGMLGSFEMAPGLATPVSELKEKYNITLAGKTEIDGVPAYQLNLKPPSGGSMGLGAMMGGLGGGTMKLWVSTANWLPVRAKVDTISIDYKNLQINGGGVDDANFVFSPPAGAQELNLGGLLGGLGGAGKLPMD